MRREVMVGTTCVMALFALGVGCGQPPQALSEGAVLGGAVVFEGAVGDKPISGARVLVTLGGEPIGEPVLTGRDGRFQIRQLPSDDFNLVVECEDYAAYDHQGATGAVLNVRSFNRGRAFVEVRLESKLTVLRGTVVTTDGEPVEGVEVRTYPRTVKVETGPDGTYAIRSGKFEPGVVYQVETQHSEYDQARSEAKNPVLGEVNEIEELEVPERQQDEVVTGGEVDNTGRGEDRVTTGDK